MPESSETQEWLHPEEQTLWRRWINVNSRINIALARQLHTDTELSLPDYAVLVQLSEATDGRQRITALAERLQWDRSRLSHQITRMTKRGLVRRESCENDGRGAFVVIEDSGTVAIKEAAPGHVRQVRNFLFDQLTNEEIHQLAHILAKLDAQFDNPLLSSPQ